MAHMKISLYFMSYCLNFICICRQKSDSLYSFAQEIAISSIEMSGCLNYMSVLYEAINLIFYVSFQMNFNSFPSINAFKY